MEMKKVFINPEIEVIKFNARDVITDSVTYAVTSSYDIESIRNIFNFKVN